MPVTWLTVTRNQFYQYKINSELLIPRKQELTRFENND